jgi:hypothetical protein
MPDRPLPAQTIIDQEQETIRQRRRQDAIAAAMITHSIGRREAVRLIDTEIAPDEDG